MVRRFANRLIAASIVGILGICIRVVTMSGTDGGGAWGGDGGGGL